MHGSSRERRRASAAVAVALVAAAAIALAALRGRSTSRRAPRATDAVAEAAPRRALETSEAGAELGVALAPAADEPLGRTEVREEVDEARSPIAGVALLPSGTLCPGGLALAWEDGPLPSPESFASARAGRGGRVVAVAIAGDGSFAFRHHLAAGKAYSVSAVAPGVVCAQRVTKVRAGDAPLVLRMQHTYGLSLRLREAGGAELRTSPAVLGGKRLSIETSPAALHECRELYALRLADLGFEPETRDAWRHVAVSDEELESLGPLVLDLEVPGYEPAVVRVPVPRLVDSLEERVIELRPAVQGFGTLAVRVIGAAGARELGLEYDRPIGVLHLSKDGARYMAHAVDARALGEPEFDPLGARFGVSGAGLGWLPAGLYSVEFVAADSRFSVAAGDVAIGDVAARLRIDCSDAGTLVIELPPDVEPDTRFVAQLHERVRGGGFVVAFPRAPYVVPALAPGSYRVEPLELGGRRVPGLSEPVAEVGAGMKAVARVERLAGTPGAR